MSPPAPAVRPPRRAVAFLGNLALLAIAVSGALGLAELMVRLVAPQQLIEPRPDLFRPADTVGYDFRPLVRTTMNTGERTVRVLTDSNGFRIGDVTPDARRRILLLGDSFMAALQVEAEESTAGLLEQALADSLGEPVRVLNAAVAGWGPGQYLARGRAILSRVAVDAVVVIIYMGNDVVEKRQDYLPPLEAYRVATFRTPTSLRWSEIVDAWLRPVNDKLERNSHLFVLLKDRLKLVLMRAGLTVEYFPEEFRLRDRGSRRWHVTTQLVADLRELAASHNTPILFVLVPAPFQVEPSIFEEYVAGLGVDPDSVDVNQPNLILGDSLRAREFDALDVLPDFRQATEEGGRLYGTVDRHLSPEGHQLLAREMAPPLLHVLRQAVPGR